MRSSKIGLLVPDLFDKEITSAKSELFHEVAPSLRSVHAGADCLEGMDPLGLMGTLSEVHLDFEYNDYRGDLLNFLQGAGPKLQVR